MSANVIRRPLRLVQLVAAVNLLVLPVSHVFGVQLARDMECVQANCNGMVSVTIATGKANDGCVKMAGVCSGTCVRCDGSIVGEYCVYSPGKSCFSSGNSWEYAKCGKRIVRNCAAGGQGPSTCCPSGGDFTKMDADCNAVKCSSCSG